MPALNSVGVEHMKSKRRQHVVELDRARLAVDLVQRQAHRDAHEERLRQLDAAVVDVQEVAVVERLQAEVVELQVALGLERRAEACQVELQQPLVEQLGLDALLDEAAGSTRRSASAMSACSTSSPRTSRRIVCSSRRAVT